MLYLALPPAPPAIAIILPNQQIYGETSPGKTSIQNDRNKSIATAQSLVCTSSQAKQSDIVSNLLEKMQLTSGQKPQDIACISRHKKSVTLSFKSQIQKQKQAKGFSPSADVELPPSAKIATASKPQTTSANTNFAEEKQSATLNNKLPDDKAGDKNAIGKILATIQELISVSLYASINNNLTDLVQRDTKQSTEIATEISNEASDKKKPEENSSNSINQEVATNKTFGTANILEVVQQLISVSLYASLNNGIDDTVKPTEIQKLPEIATSTPQQESSEEVNSNKKPEKNPPNQETGDNQKVATNNNLINQTNNSPTNALIEKLRNKPVLELARIPGEPFLVGVIINGREIGTLDIIQEDNNIFIPLESFGEIAGFTIEKNNGNLQVKTPLGVVKLQAASLKQINGINYITKAAIKEQLSINVELNTADLTLLADLPWRGGNGQYRSRTAELKPEFFAPSSGLSTYKQELNIVTSSGDTSFRSSSLLGGRLLGGAWRLRLDNNFVNQPDISEYFFYKRNGQFRYQIGRQQVGIHPLLSGLDLTGLQFGYSNLPEESFGTTYSANELLPRRSRPIQTFRGQAPPAGFVQLRVSGIVVAQQQVGFDGQYEFVDVNLPVGQSNEIEVLIYERNNLRVPLEIRSVRINASDLLLPSGGNVQLGGLGFSGNLAQNTLFGDSNSSYAGKPVGFYQLRQGISSNLTLEGSVQAAPDVIQSQAGLVWRLANPIILSASVGSSYDKVGYAADLDILLDRLELNANSQSLPNGYTTGKKTTERFNHSLELKYRLNNSFNLGFIARSRQDEGNSANYILPVFSARPFSNVSLSGRPDFEGRYLFNAFYQPNDLTRLSFNTYGSAYISDLSYNLSRNYQLSLGSEFGGNLAPRYSLGISNNSNSLSQLSWNLGVAFRDGEVAPTAGASMQVLPGLFARLEYQGIPSRTKGNFGGFGDDRFTVSLVSDLSFAGGRVAPASYSGISKERGAISGRIVVEGGKKGFDLSGSNIRVSNNRSQTVGAVRTDSSGNFFIGNLPEGNYVIELEPDELPIELSVPKSSLVAQVANSAVTKLDFPVRAEFGLAGRVTDVSGQPIEQVRIELINSTGIRALSTITDQNGLYRLDGVPVGKYTLRVSPQDALNPTDTLPKRQVEISNQFVYDQNLQLPISSAAKKK
jgi:hypothetical protein